MAGKVDDPLPLVAPPSVAAEAERLGLGPMLERVGRSDSKFTMALLLVLTGVAAMAGSIGGLSLLGAWFRTPGILLFVWGIGAPIAGIVLAFRRLTSRFLYQGGYAEVTGQKWKIFTWNDIASVEIQYFGERAMFKNKIKGYAFRLRNGQKVKVPSGDSFNVKVPFEIKLMELVQAAGHKPTHKTVTP